MGTGTVLQTHLSIGDCVCEGQMGREFSPQEYNWEIPFGKQLILHIPLSYNVPCGTFFSLSGLNQTYS